MNEKIKEIVDAYIERFASLDRLAQGNAVMGDFWVADRALWALIISNPNGGMLAGFVGSAIIAAADVIGKLPGQTSENAEHLVWQGHMARINPIVDFVMRVQPELNSVDVRTYAIDKFRERVSAQP